MGCTTDISHEILRKWPRPARLTAAPLLFAYVLDATLAKAHNVWVGLLGPATRGFAPGPPHFMSDFFRQPLFVAALWFAVIFAMLAGAIAIVRRFRGSAADDQPRANDILAKFRDLHARGGLSDDEYRTIKTKLATQVETELTSSDKKS